MTVPAATNSTSPYALSYQSYLDYQSLSSYPSEDGYFHMRGLDSNRPPDQETAFYKFNRGLNIGYVGQAAYSAFRFAARATGNGVYPGLPSLRLSTQLWMRHRSLSIHLTDPYAGTGVSSSSNYIYPMNYRADYFRKQAYLGIADTVLNELAPRALGLDQIAKDDSAAVRFSGRIMETFSIAGPDEAVPHLVGSGLGLMTRSSRTRRSIENATFVLEPGHPNYRRTNHALMADGIVSGYASSQNMSDEIIYGGQHEYQYTAETEAAYIQMFADILGCSVDDASCQEEAETFSNMLAKKDQSSLEAYYASLKERYGLTNEDIAKIDALSSLVDMSTQTQSTPLTELEAAQLTANTLGQLHNIRSAYASSAQAHFALQNARDGEFVLREHLALGAAELTLSSGSSFARFQVNNKNNEYQLSDWFTSLALDVGVKGASIGTTWISDNNAAMRLTYLYGTTRVIDSAFVPYALKPLIYKDDPNFHTNLFGNPAGNPLLNGMRLGIGHGFGIGAAYASAKSTQLFWSGLHHNDGKQIAAIAFVPAMIGVGAVATKSAVTSEKINENTEARSLETLDLNKTQKERMWDEYWKRNAYIAGSAALTSVLYLTVPRFQDHVNNGDRLFDLEFMPDPMSNTFAFAMQHTNFEFDPIAMFDGNVSGSVNFQMGVQGLPSPRLPEENSFIGIDR